MVRVIQATAPESAHERLPTLIRVHDRCLPLGGDRKDADHDRGDLVHDHEGQLHRSEFEFNSEREVHGPSTGGMRVCEGRRRRRSAAANRIRAIAMYMAALPGRKARS